MPPADPTEPVSALRCRQCDRELTDPADAVTVGEGVFCRSCFASLERDLARIERAQGEDVSYPSALLGAVAGGALGVALWWGFTVVTRISFGLVAIVIGYLVGTGILRLTGGKRTRGLQILSVSVAGIAFFYAQYLVTRTFVMRMSEGGTALPLVPDPQLAYEVIRAGFNAFDMVFLAIVLFQAWRMPAPARLRAAA